MGFFGLSCVFILQTERLGFSFIPGLTPCYFGERLDALDDGAVAVAEDGKVGGECVREGGRKRRKGGGKSNCTFLCLHHHLPPLPPTAPPPPPPSYISLSPPPLFLFLNHLLLLLPSAFSCFCPPPFILFHSLLVFVKKKDKKGKKIGVGYKRKGRKKERKRK